MTNEELDKLAYETWRYAIRARDEASGIGQIRAALEKATKDATEELIESGEYEKGYAAGWEACDREAEMSQQQPSVEPWTVACDLLREVMQLHRDKESPNYNECEKDECMWCSLAAKVLAIGVKE